MKKQDEGWWTIQKTQVSCQRTKDLEELQRVRCLLLHMTMMKKDKCIIKEAPFEFLSSVKQTILGLVEFAGRG